MVSKAKQFEALGTIPSERILSGSCEAIAVQLDPMCRYVELLSFQLSEVNPVSAPCEHSVGSYSRLQPGALSPQNQPISPSSTRLRCRTLRDTSFQHVDVADLLTTTLEAF